MEVHPLQRQEIPAVAEAMQRHPVLVGDRLTRQDAGETVYLVAWEGGRPVGQALLHWRRPNPERVAATLQGLPYLEDVYVPHDQRKRGAGTSLLQAAAETVRRKGGNRLTLAVNVDNSGARRLYTRLGYVDAGVPAHAQPFWHYSAEGVLHSHEETVMEMVRHLDGAPAPAESRDSQASA
jgi:GNAT superfamily N-acetyltransferase